MKDNSKQKSKQSCKRDEGNALKVQILSLPFCFNFLQNNIYAQLFFHAIDQHQVRLFNPDLYAFKFLLYNLENKNLLDSLIPTYSRLGRESYGLNYLI